MLLLNLFVRFCCIQVKCGVRGDTGPGCNAVGMIDRHVLGIQHLYTRPVYLKTAVCKKKCS
jgi:heparan-alpha-glucosaminide N-acetyltransferase